MTDPTSRVTAVEDGVDLNAGLGELAFELLDKYYIVKISVRPDEDPWRPDVRFEQLRQV